VTGTPAPSLAAPVVTGDTSDEDKKEILEDAVTEETPDEMDLIEPDPERWIDGGMDYEHRRSSGQLYYSEQATVTLQEPLAKTIVDYFLYFLALEFLKIEPQILPSAVVHLLAFHFLFDFRLYQLSFFIILCYKAIHELIGNLLIYMRVTIVNIPL